MKNQAITVAVISILFLSCGKTAENTISKMSPVDQEKYKQGAELLSKTYGVKFRPFDSMIFTTLLKHDRYNQFSSLWPETVMMYRRENGKYTLSQCCYIRTIDFCNQANKNAPYLMEIPQDFDQARLEIKQLLEDAGELPR